MSGEGLFIRAWRLSRQQSLEELAEKTGLSISLLDALETDDRHVELTIMETVARGLDIPAAWLHTDPAEFDLLFKDEEDENDEENRLVPWMADPLIARIREGRRTNRILYALLTTLLERGDAKLLRAAEINLRSLLKQARQTSLPWQSRPPGHFEPPSD
ncbi:MAG TPA: helix-turn-helix transcriptional regulator [Nitrospiraceae bacterium]|nr:helix-turn-helix transcriptional regulator [Nitrospiraceae bacterium]